MFSWYKWKINCFFLDTKLLNLLFYLFRLLKICVQIFVVSESPKDTRDEELQKVTFEPALETFEMAIAREHDIKDDRIPAKSYWY